MASARYVASKIATDLRQLQRYYDEPSDDDITDFAVEAALLAYHRCVDKVIYGFKRDGAWILTLEYTFVDGMLSTDDRAGGVYRHANVAGAAFSSYLFYSGSWSRLSDDRRKEIEEALPVSRTPAVAPGYAGGFHTSDRTYSSHSTGFTRSSYRPL